MMNNKGQLTIWVIVAVAIAVLIGLIFFLSGGKVPSISRGQEFNPENFIDQCVRDAVRQKVDMIMPQGGFENPSDYHLFNNTKVVYVCKNINNFDPCVNQYPAFSEQISKELAREIDEDVSGCFDSLQVELEKRNYEYSFGQDGNNIEIELKPEVIQVGIGREFSYGKDGSEKRISSFRSSVSSPLGKMTDVVGNFIVYEESQRCYADTLGWVLLYGEQRGIDIKKTQSYDATKVYTVIDKKTGKEMNVAVRGCVVAHGFYGI